MSAVTSLLHQPAVCIQHERSCFFVASASWMTKHWYLHACELRVHGHCKTFPVLPPACLALTDLLVLTELMAEGAAMIDVLVCGFIPVWCVCSRRWPVDVSSVQAPQTTQAMDQGPGDCQGRVHRGPQRLQ